MKSRDYQYNSLLVDAQRLSVPEFLDKLIEYSSEGKGLTEIGTGNNLLHGLADGKCEPEVFAEIMASGLGGDAINHFNANNMSAVDILIKNQKVAHLILLQKRYLIDLSGYSSKGQNALHIAARRDNPKFIRFLINEGVSPVEKDNNDRTPLDVSRRYACFLNADVMEHAIHNKIDKNLSRRDIDDGYGIN